MSTPTLLTLGAVALIAFGLIAVWYLLDVFQAWRTREAAPDEVAREPGGRILHEDGDTDAAVTSRSEVSRS